MKKQRVVYTNKSIRAFTLIELLVVIAIVALLLAIITPALQKSKEKTKLLICKSNLKQQTIACEMYLNDNEQHYPYDGHLGYFAWGGQQGDISGIPSSRIHLLHPYLGLPQEIDASTDLDGIGDVFKCPGDKGGGDGWGEKRGYIYQPTFWDSTGMSYAYNSDGNNNNVNEGLALQKKTRVRNPYQTILVCDQSFRAYFQGFYPCWMYAYTHNKKENGWGNVAFVDNHINFIQATNDKPDFQSGDGWTFIGGEKNE